MVMVKHVSTKKTRLLVIKWMLSTAQREGTKGLLSKCIHKFPQHFRQAEHSNMTKASKWWNGREAFMRGLDEEGNHSSMVRSNGGLQQRMLCKTLQGHGRKRATWVLWLHDKLLGEFSRLRSAGVKFSTKMLLALAKEILMRSTHFELSPYFKKTRSRKCLIDMLTLSCIQAFMARFNIVGRIQIRKLLVSLAKQTYIQQMIAFHMDELQRGFIQGDLHDDLVENVDETHFIVNMDNGRMLGFRGDDVVKYTDVVSDGLGMTMVVRVSGSSNGIIHSPFMIFQNDKCSYPICGCLDNVPGVSYRTAKKGFIIGIIWIEWLNEVRAIQPDCHGQRRVLYIDNCTAHNDSIQALLTADRLNIEIRKLPANAIDMCQPVDSFVISKIKDASSARWEAYKLHCVQNEVWQNEVREDGRVSGMLKNPGKCFFGGWL